MKTPTTSEGKKAVTRSYSPFFKKSGEQGFFSSKAKAQPPFFSPPAIQAKQQIGKPNDRYEQEADAVAEKVVSGETATVTTATVQQKCEHCSEGEQLEKKEDLPEEELMMKANPLAASNAANGQQIEEDLKSTKGSGRPLDKSISAEMGAGIGADFDAVKVHTDSKAVELSQQLNAQAFTNGKDVYFNQGKYSPQNKEGKKLLAHELTHVVQQTGTGNANGANIAQTKQDTGTKPPASSKKPTVSTFAKPEISMKKLRNGQNQISQKLPFSITVEREKVADPASKSGEVEQNEPEPSVFVPLVKPTQKLLSSAHDSSIAASFAYLSTVAGTRSPNPGSFGTTGAELDLENINIQSSFGTIFGSGEYTVTGDCVHTITWGVVSGVGPNSQVDISGVNDADINACNYQLVASDLTPNMSSDNGRPPRTNFWAEDLTIRHERFHAINQRQLSWGPQVNTAMQNWLSGQRSSSASHVKDTLVPQALVEGIRVYNAFVATPAAEGDTYGDGAPLYAARSNAIRAKGDGGGYGQVSVNVTNHPKGGGTHTVVSGETLTSIAQQVYGDGKYWLDIHRANPGLAQNGGNLIYPGQVFTLPSINFDKEIFLVMVNGIGMAPIANVIIPGGGSQTFTELPNTFFDDTTNCAGNIDVFLLDVDGNSLISTVWAIPANNSVRSGNMELNMEITGAPAGP